jgi:hypothetical protein
MMEFQIVHLFLNLVQSQTLFFPRSDIIFRHAQLQAPRGQEELQLRKQVHLLLVVNALLEYQGILTYVDPLSFLWRVTHSLVHD